ncbi:MAG: flavodoxin family protein [Bacillota bacterium]
MAEKILILGVSGSPRKSATSEALDAALAAAASVDGVQTRKIELAGRNINCCKNCNVCLDKKLEYCPAFQDDFKREDLEVYKECHGIILATPIYHMTATGLLQNFISRMRPLGPYGRQGKFGCRMGASIAVGGMRNGGQDLCLSVLNGLLQSTGTNIIGGGVQFYSGAAIWSQNKTSLQDEWGRQEAEALGRKLAYMCKLLQTGREHMEYEINDANLLGYVDQEALMAGYRARGL